MFVRDASPRRRRSETRDRDWNTKGATPKDKIWRLAGVSDRSRHTIGYRSFTEFGSQKTNVPRRASVGFRLRLAALFPRRGMPESNSARGAAIGPVNFRCRRSRQWPLGEIGRHARLRILCLTASGFESPSGHLTNRRLCFGVFGVLIPIGSVECCFRYVLQGRERGHEGVTQRTLVSGSRFTGVKRDKVAVPSENGLRQHLYRDRVRYSKPV